MKSYYSIIRFINNSLSNENLAIGMIVISGASIYFRFSNEKINLVKKINPLNSDLLEYTVGKIQTFIKAEVENKKTLFSEFTFNVEYLNRLSIYNNGFLKFDSPSGINISFDKILFDNFFKRYIDLNIKMPSKQVVDHSFRKAIKHVFSEPLKNQIDIDYKVKKGSIPSLFFDYKLDGIGINGVIYTVKSLDLNAEPPLDLLNKQVSELESLNARLDLFSKKLDMNLGKNEHYLVIDKYKGNKPSFRSFYETLKDQSPSDFSYKVISSFELNDVTMRIKNRNTRKFSEELSLLEDKNSN